MQARPRRPRDAKRLKGCLPGDICLHGIIGNDFFLLPRRRFPRSCEWTSGGPVAMAFDARGCRLVGWIQRRRHVLVHDPDPLACEQLAVRWSSLLRRAKVDPGQTRLTWQQVVYVLEHAPGATPSPFVQESIERYATAVHEAGHAIAGWMMTAPATRIVGRPLGKFLGVTYFRPTLPLVKIKSSLDPRERVRAFESALNNLTIDVGGAAAEALLWQLRIDEVRDHSAAGRSRAIATGARHDWKLAATRMRSLLRACGKTSDGVREMCALERVVQARLRTVWPAVLKLADAVYTQKSLCGDTLKAYLPGGIISPGFWRVVTRAVGVRLPKLPPTP